MYVMNLQAEKMNIIEQFKAFKKEPEFYGVPEALQKLVMDRFEKVRKDSDRLLDWEEAKKTLKA